MATLNPFDLLGDNDNEDPSLLIAAQQQKLSQLQLKQKLSAAPAAQPPKAAKLPSKPLPPAQAVREGKSDSGRGGRGGGRGFGRGAGRGGFNRDFANGESNGFSGGSKPYEVDSVRDDSGRSFEKRGYGGSHGSFRGGRRGGFNDGDAGDGDRIQRRIYERRSGTGRGSEFKRDGTGRGNWGSATDELPPPEIEDTASGALKNVTEKQAQDESADANKELPAEEEEKEEEEKEMTLEEYEKVLEEKRKALLSLKNEERKVELDKDLKSMQALSNKKANDDVFIKLGSEKDKRKDVLDKDEKAKKAVSINEFLKPAEGERYYRGGRGRGRGGRDHGSRGGYTGGNFPAPSIEDRQHFPSLGGK